jgi:predicted nucleotidyltransferase
MHSLNQTIDPAPASAQQRREAVLVVAEKCSQILKENFNATEVIVFGSLRGDTPWHNSSDLDLAVRGLPRETLLEAYRQLQDQVPHWLMVDLVDIERADERVRDRILQTTPIPENMYLALKVRLNDEIAAMEQTISTLNLVLAQAKTVPDIIVIPALASYIEDFYSGCERLAERIAVSLDEGLPTGENWHYQLLTAMGEPREQGRPALWDRSLMSELDAYRRFRHRVRHLYNIDLDGPIVLEMAQKTPTVFNKIKQSVSLFNEWLIQQESEITD